MNNKVEFFEERVGYFTRQVVMLKSKYNKLSIFRIAIFLFFFMAAILCLKYNLPDIILFLVLLFIPGFGFLVKVHGRVKKQKQLKQRLLEINREEKTRLCHDFEGINDAIESLNEDHPYAADLDIFGRNSLFQLINRAGTSGGLSMVKLWLLNAASKNTLEQRQDAVKELIPLIDWRQKMQAYGSKNVKKKLNEQSFYDWLQGEDIIRKNWFYRILPYPIILINSFLFYGYFADMFSIFAIVLPFIIGGPFIYKILDYSRDTYEMTQSGLHILESIEAAVQLIEGIKFQNELLVKLQANLKVNNDLASEKTGGLRRIFEWLSQRQNGMYHIINSVYLLDYLILLKAENWRAKHKNKISDWFEVVANFEALSSLAAFSFANEDYFFPKISEEKFLFNATAMGHPLIFRDHRVNNDFKLDSRGKSCIITGSNMSGKSTFLRTVGVNAVLAFAGAPVCADYFEISKFQIFTNMRTKDNLEENVSSFYADLLRLKMLLEQISEEKPVLYLLDEILKGTNSADRHIGAESLILQLSKLNTFGLVSTHDLELGNLQEKNKQIENFNFSSTIDGEEIVFDYKLREGICKSTNASQLMAKIGIHIKS